MSTPADQLPEITVTAARAGALPKGRQPRGVVQLGPVGALTDVPGWTSFSVSNNSYYEADTFKITYAASALTSTKVEGIAVGIDANWFSEQTEIFAQIYAGFPQDPANPQTSELTNLIYGRIDDIAYNPKTEEISLTGRDLTAVFIDNRISDQYKNKTSSQIATLLAKSHGLDTSNITATKTLAGTYYTRDQVMLASDRSEWDLLALLAREEGFVIFVNGNSLFFEPDPRPTDADDPYTITWTPKTSTNGSPVSTVVDINFSRSLTVAKGISVTARSPNTSTGRAVVQSYPSSPKSIGAGKSSPFGTVQQYTILLPAGLSPTKVAAAAQKAYENIISHEMKMTASMPADDVLDVSTPIMVRGTGTAFDQLYFPRLITRVMDADNEGYRMTVEAQNTSGSETPDA